MGSKINHLDTSGGSVKKRILFVITQSEIGGAQRFFYNLISHLNQTKYQILVVTGQIKGDDYIQRTLRNIHIDTITVNSLGRVVNIFSDLRTVFKLREIIKKFGPNTIFLNSSKAGFLGSLATVFPKKLLNIKIIYRIGGWSFNDPISRWNKWLWLQLERISARWKDYIIVNSPDNFIQAGKLKIRPRQEVIYVPNGIDVYKTYFLERDTAREILLNRTNHSTINPQPKIIIGTIANLYPAKGLEYLIETAEYFKKKENVEFFVIGDGPERLKLENLIKIKKLEKKIFLVGRLADAHQYLPGFDIFVLSSVKEGSPWSVLEAMAAKVPVIATAVGGVSDILNDKNGVLVPPRKPEALAKEIMQLLADDKLRGELSIQAHQTVLFKYDLEKMVNRIEEIL